MPCGVPQSIIAQFVATLVGKAEGYIVSQVTKLVTEALAKLRGQCPDLSGLKQLLKQRDNLLNAIQGVEKKIKPIEEYATKLDKPIKAAKVIVTLLEFMPIPNTIGTPPLGGPADIGGQVYSMPVGKMNRFSSLLRLACKLIEALEREGKDITSIVTSGLATLEPTKDKLKSIDLKLFECVDKLPDDLKEEVMKEVESLPSNIGLLDEVEDEPGSYKYRNNSGINYVIKVLDDPESPSIAKRRYAAVFNEDGVIVLRGPVSFSSSTRILVDEIKFRINNQLP